MGDPFRIHDPTKYRDEGLEEAMNQLPSALVENAGPAFRSDHNEHPAFSMSLLQSHERLP